jgi:hypothetical protein
VLPPLNINIENVKKIFLDNKNRKKFICKYKVEGQITPRNQAIIAFQIHVRNIQIVISYEAATFRISETYSGFYNLYSYSQSEHDPEKKHNGVIIIRAAY